MAERTLDANLLDEMVRFSSNVARAPDMVPAPDEVNLEVTPHQTAHTLDKVRLLHYQGTGDIIHRTPIVIAYALINRYHILDIQPTRSWVRNLLSQGYDVYMVDWGTPSNMDRYLGFDDYVNVYLDSCIEHVCDAASVDGVTLQGYCTGGTIATVYAALHPQKVRNFVATAPVIDGWKDTTVVSNLSKHVEVDTLVDTVGNMPPEFMYYCFSVLKPFEQGIEKYIRFFKNIDNKKFVDNFLRVEKWLSDTPPIPGELFREWIRNIYQDNLLVNNKMHVDGHVVDLRRIKMPVFTQVAVGDHLVSPECSMPLHYAVGSSDKTLRLYPTGHVGMIASGLSQKMVLPEMGSWLSKKSD